VDRAAIAALIAFYAAGAVLIPELDDGCVQLELLQQEGQKIVHDDLQVEGPIDDLGGLQPYEKRLAALVERGAYGAEDIVNRLHARTYVGEKTVDNGARCRGADGSGQTFLGEALQVGEFEFRDIAVGIQLAITAIGFNGQLGLAFADE